MALDTLIKDNILVNRGVYESKMTIQNLYKTYTKVFKEEAVVLVIAQNCTVPCAQQDIFHYISMFYNSYRLHSN
jgi:hypothetical protein